MKKKQLSEAEITQIIELRKKGGTWLGIEKVTGIPRRLAQRVYLEWENKNTIPELKEARQSVAIEVFRNHVNSLLTLSRFLASWVRLPTVSDLEITVDQYLENHLGQTIIARQIPIDLSGEAMTKKNIRDNIILWDSLRTHTIEVVNWNKFDDYKREWNRYLELARGAKRGAREKIIDFLEVEPMLQRETLANLISRDVITVMVRSFGEDETPLVGKIRDLPQGDLSLSYFGGLTIALRFSDVTSPNKWELSIDKKILTSLKDIYMTIKELLKYLVDLLDNTLLLEPSILRTKCDICPA